MSTSPGSAIALALALAGCASPSIDVVSSKRMQECFARIDDLTAETGWESLRTVGLPSGSFEIRVWTVDAFGQTGGLTFGRKGSEWTGHQVAGSLSKGATVRTVVPRSGWNEFWARAESLGILTLPDSSALGEEEPMYDGWTTVVEVKLGSKYRAYHYYCAGAQRWAEAQKMAEIERLIYGELGRP